MQKYSQKHTDSPNIPEPPLGLFDKIICAITLEIEFKQTKKILLAFISLLIVSAVSLPFSFNLFLYEWRASGIYYFISAALGNLNMFFALWQDFTLSIFESLPILPIALFAINIALLLFAVRLFIYKKGLLVKYLKHKFA